MRIVALCPRQSEIKRPLERRCNACWHARSFAEPFLLVGIVVLQVGDATPGSRVSLTEWSLAFWRRESACLNQRHRCQGGMAHSQYARTISLGLLGDARLKETLSSLIYRQKRRGMLITTKTCIGKISQMPWFWARDWHLCLWVTAGAKCARRWIESCIFWVKRPAVSSMSCCCENGLHEMVYFRRSLPRRPLKLRASRPFPSSSNPGSLCMISDLHVWAARGFEPVLYINKADDSTLTKVYAEHPQILPVLQYPTSRPLQLGWGRYGSRPHSS